MKIRRFKVQLPIDLDDIFILAGTFSFTYGLWSYDPRAALMALGVWLVFLGRPGVKRGDG